MSVGHAPVPLSDEELDRATQLADFYGLRGFPEAQLSGYLRAAINEVHRLRREVGYWKEQAEKAAEH